MPTRAVDDAEARRTWVIAHRGASVDRPENTLAAFDAALEQGADGIELDLQLSKDGVPIVYHDRTLDRAGAPGRRVADLDCAELAALRIPATAVDAGPARLATLDEVLDGYGRRTRLLIEIKGHELHTAPDRHHALCVAFAQAVQRHRSEAQLFALAFEVETLAILREVAPALPRLLNLKPPPILMPGLRRRLGALQGLSVDVRTLTRPFGTAVARVGKPLFVYTCNSDRHVARALAARATGIMSDRPSWLRMELTAKADSGAA